jgi:hypothetical protein
MNTILVITLLGKDLQNKNRHTGDYYFVSLRETLSALTPLQIIEHNAPRFARVHY